MTTIYWTGSNNITSSSNYNYSTSTLTSDGTTNSPDLSNGVNTLQISGADATLNSGDTISVDVYSGGTFQQNLGNFSYQGFITVSGMVYPIADTGTTFQAYGIILAAGSYANNNVDPFSCFLRGTRILTASGEVPIESLRPGDLLVTRFGPLRRLKFLGRQSFNGAFLRQSGAPVRIAAGALGADQPCRDLFVSPDHSMLIDDHLVQAKLLINGISITQTATDAMVDYFHLDFGTHDCVVADGCWSESYAEMGNRMKFHNAAEFDAAFPDHQPIVQPMCLPQVQGDGPELPKIRAAVMSRLPIDACSDEADLHVIADGVRIEALPEIADGKAFQIPPDTKRLQLVSRATSPALMGWNADNRILGVNLLALIGRVGGQSRKLYLDDPALADGCYPAEFIGDQITRWTNGDVTLPVGRFGFGRQGFELIVESATLPTYLLAAEALAA
ncbi:MAG: Hint domain-containing protein [Acetobacteraceae bacterium]|nr:Hint domain-containing protein [Acetobacteraceae bacterium]